MCSSTKAVIGEPAPGFQCHAIVDGRIKDISLNTYIEAKHWLVLIFFPRAWSFICPTEIRSFSARLEEFLYSRSCAVAFASTDSEFCLRAWNSTSELEGGLGNVHVPLVSDPTHKLASDYGVLNKSEGTAQRALFVIDPKGYLRHMSVNDIDVGRSVDEVIRVLDALSFKDKYGEGCPVDWKRGDHGIDVTTKARVEGSVELDSRRSWTDWARPKLHRGWSGTSQKSTNGGNVKLMPAVPVPTRVPNSECQASPTLAGGNASPSKLAIRPMSQSAYSAPHSPGSTYDKHEMDMEESGRDFCLEQSELGNEHAVKANSEVGAAF